MVIYLEASQTNKSYRLKIGGQTYYTSFTEIMLFSCGEIDRIKFMTWDEIEKQQKNGTNIKSRYRGWSNEKQI